MGSKTVVEEKKIEETIRTTRGDSFTVLDFMEVFKKVYLRDWEIIVEKFGVFGSKRRYTVSTYLSNRLDVHSQKPYSILIPFTRYKEGKFKDYRKTTIEEQKVYGSPWNSGLQEETRQL